MSITKLMLQLLTVAVLLTALIFAGCKGDKGPAGPAGQNGQNGTNNPMPPRITATIALPDSVGAGLTSQVLVSAYDPNGDSLTYEWSATAGTFSNPLAATTMWTAPQERGVVLIRVSVTANGDVVRDSIAVGVNTSVPTVLPSWAGNDAVSCGHCHSATVQQWNATPHAAAYDSLGANASNPYCLQCHTVGFDDRYDHSGNLISHGVNNGGYDDNPRAELQGVQCESCHGAMGPDPTTHAPQLTNVINGQQCNQCHTQNTEVDSSGHGTAVARAGGNAAFLTEWGGSSCNGCHTSEGFIKANDPDWMSASLSPANGLNCVTCHDPHNKTNDSQLRTIATVTQVYGGEANPAGRTITGWGNGQLCAQCHHGRRNQASIQGQIASGSTHPGPHDNPQADMLNGYGDWEVAGIVNRAAQHTTSMLPNMCVDCHMYTIPRGQPGGPDFGHRFAPNIAKCQGCHSGATDFDIGGVQTHVTALIDSLAALLPHDGTGAVPSAMDTVNWTQAQRAAGYTYYFVKADGSRGVHNRDYAISILRNAVQSLSSSPN